MEKYVLHEERRKVEQECGTGIRSGHRKGGEG